MMTPWGPVRLEHPWMLTSLAVLPVLVYYSYRSLTDFPRGQRLLSLAVRAAFVTLLVLALCGPTLPQPPEQRYVVFLIDHSRSVGPQARQEAEDFITAALEQRGAHRTAFVYFAARPSPVQADRQPPADLDDTDTDLAAAIEVAHLSVPSGHAPHLVLLSDGNQTTGDALRAARRAGVPLSAVPLRQRSEDEVQVSEVRLPSQVAPGEPFVLEVLIDSNHDDHGVLEIYRNFDRLPDQELTLTRGPNRFRLPQTILDEPRVAYKVRLRGFRDTLQDNNEGEGLVVSAGKPSVLVVEDDPNKPARRNLAPLLEKEGLRIVSISSQAMPETLAELQNYDLVILSDVPVVSDEPGKALTQRQMDVLKTYVEELGGGLLVIGGEHSFGPGGYYKTTLEELLPVSSDFKKEQEKADLALVLILDKSGSMSEEQKLELAKEAARRAIELLGPRDHVGVIAFNDTPERLADVRADEDRRQVLDKLRQLKASGGTIMYGPLKQAFDELRSTTARFKHVILLTDGVAESDVDFVGLAREMALAKITVSTVGVGSDCDRPLLERIARAGGGRHYFAADASSVPQIFSRETMAASKSGLRVDPSQAVLLYPTPVLKDIDLDSAPLLGGYVITRPRATSEWILATDKRDPLLSWWRYGLGMTGVFTSGIKNDPWTAEWIRWNQFGPFWIKVVRYLMRKESRGLSLHAERKGRAFAVTVDAVDADGRFLNDTAIELSVIDPQLGVRRQALFQSAPGRYAAEVATPVQGAYQVQVVQRDPEGKVLQRQSFSLVVGYPDELRLRPTDEELLQSLTRSTGGVYRPEPGQVFDAVGHPAPLPRPLWPNLVCAALLLFLADVAVRRIDLGVLLSRWYRRGARR
jgi:Ca-activated chloride channel family protein